MPAVEPSESTKVLVTGANGFLATWLVQTLLDKGYSVRGTVRSTSKGEYLRKTFAKYGHRFEYVIVEDMAKEGAFDEAVKGVDAIEHTASPVHLGADDPQEMIAPAVQGTTGILDSALKNGTSVKRIVITSSCAAIVQVHQEHRIYSEENWNEQSVNEIQELGKSASPLAKYRSSKVLAEKAVWEFYNRNKNNVKWDITVLNPPWVFGPSMNDVPTYQSLNASNVQWCNKVLGRGPSLAGNPGWIDVRDLAELHALSLEKEEAGGQRVIVFAGHFDWEDWIDAANSLNPPVSQPLPKSDPARRTTRLITFNSKADRIFGYKFRTLETTTRDILTELEKRGWL